MIKVQKAVFFSCCTLFKCLITRWHFRVVSREKCNMHMLSVNIFFWKLVWMRQWPVTIMKWITPKNLWYTLIDCDNLRTGKYEIKNQILILESRLDSNGQYWTLGCLRIWIIRETVQTMLQKTPILTFSGN